MSVRIPSLPGRLGQQVWYGQSPESWHMCKCIAAAEAIKTILAEPLGRGIDMEDVDRMVLENVVQRAKRYRKGKGKGKKKPNPWDLELALQYPNQGRGRLRSRTQPKQQAARAKGARAGVGHRYCAVKQMSQQLAQHLLEVGSMHLGSGMQLLPREAPEEATPQRQRTRTGEGPVQTGPGCPEARGESCVSPAHVENAREARRGRPLSRGGARRSPRRADKSQREIILAGAISPSFLFPSLLGELQSHSSSRSSNSSRCQSSLRALLVCPCASRVGGGPLRSPQRGTELGEMISPIPPRPPRRG